MGLQRLRTAFRSESGFPDRTADNTIIIATWNNGEFGKSKFGYRSDEPYYYIAEILSRYDLVALQEVSDLDGSAIWRRSIS